MSDTPQTDTPPALHQGCGVPGPRLINPALKEIALQGLWKNNPALVQILGLCPVLAVTNTAVNALGLGLATTLVLVLSNLAVSLVRQWVPNEIRIPVFVMIIAAFVTCVQLLMNAYLFGLYQALGIFIALIVTNCIIIGRAEAFASRNPPLLSAFDGLMMGVGFSCVLLILGGSARYWVRAPCLTAPISCWAPGPPACGWRSITRMPASCWRSCHRAPSWPWVFSSPPRMPSTPSCASPNRPRPTSPAPG